METTIKAVLQKADMSVELRRFPLTVENQKTFAGAFKGLEVKIYKYFTELATKNLTLAWQDSDGDYVVMSTDEELMEAVNQTKDSPLKVFITVEGNKAQTLATNDDDFFTMIDRAELNPEGSPTEGTEKNAEVIEGDDDIFIGEVQPPNPMDVPPFPGFGFAPGPGGCVPPPPPPPFPRRAFWKRDLMGGMFPHGGFRGGPRRGVSGPGGPFFMPHHDAIAALFRPQSRRFSGRREGCGSDKRGQNGEQWKKQLRELVPVEHRRWAKNYIRDWRSNHLANATTTTSGEEIVDKTKKGESNNVPDTYAKWLDGMLPRWHKRWGAEKPQDEVEEFDVARKIDFESIKATVPWEFRRWVKWYLNRHFAPKGAPQFRGCRSRSADPMAEGEAQEGCPVQTDSHPMKKQMKQERKMLKKSIPPAHRRWAKTFIRQWRLENKLNAEKSSSSSAESDSAEAEKASKGQASVPEDYPTWLRMLLSKWHGVRGYISATDKEMSAPLRTLFVDTVPMEFRKWVRIFLHRRFEKDANKKHQGHHHRHGHGHRHGPPAPHHGGRRCGRGKFGTASMTEGLQQHSDETSKMTVDAASTPEVGATPTPDVDDYRQMLRAFQRQWLKEKQDGFSSASDPEFWIVSDSDDDDDVELLEEKRVASSMKRLRLDENGANDAKQAASKEVRFETEEAGKQQQAPMMKIRNNNGNFSPQFRRWARNELFQWDGKTLENGNEETNQNGGVPQDSEGEEILSPRMYRWMAKVLAMREKKLMKQEYKEAKRMMKSMRKAQRFQ